MSLPKSYLLARQKGFDQVLEFFLHRGDKTSEDLCFAATGWQLNDKLRDRDGFGYFVSLGRGRALLCSQAGKPGQRLAEILARQGSTLDYAQVIVGEGFLAFHLFEEQFQDLHPVLEGCLVE